MPTKKKQTARKKAPAPEEQTATVRVYVPLVGGAPIIAVEQRRRAGRIAVTDAAHFQMSDDQTHFVFSAMNYITKDTHLYESGLVADGRAPEHVARDYDAWRAGRAQ